MEDETTKGAFAQLVRVVQTGGIDDEETIEALEMLCDDLGFVDILARAFPEAELKKLEADAKASLWDVE